MTELDIKWCLEEIINFIEYTLSCIEYHSPEHRSLDKVKEFLKTIKEGE